MTEPQKPVVRYEGEWLYAAAPEQVWPLVVNTDRLNQAMGASPVHYTDTPDPRGGLRRRACYGRGVPLSWDEVPNEWIEGRELRMRRRYHRGPLAGFALRVTLTPEPTGTRVRLVLEFEPTRPLLLPLIRLVARGTIKGFREGYERLQAYFAGTVQEPFALPVPALSELQQTRIRTLGDRLRSQGLSPTAVESLTRHLLTAPDDEAVKMRPFELARRWGTDRRELLKVFLHATKAGLLELKWDLLCPGCRGARDSQSTLSGLAGKAHCPACNIDTTADFGQSVELSFRPNPAVRQVALHDF